MPYGYLDPKPQVFSAEKHEEHPDVDVLRWSGDSGHFERVMSAAHAALTAGGYEPLHEFEGEGEHGNMVALYRHPKTNEVAAMLRHFIVPEEDALFGDPSHITVSGRNLLRSAKFPLKASET